MHSFYLRNLYLKNLLRTPGGVTLAGTPIDITKVKVPAYFISTVEDHIAPWQSTYAGARMLQGPVRFVLGGSGHIAGIINPPAANKYGYWVNDKMDAQPDNWLAKATQHAGSWWTDWGKWAAKHGDKKIAARKPGNAKFKAIEDAPGSYVQQRIG
jgi:polyhydroxyalkanoate synthase